MMEIESKHNDFKFILQDPDTMNSWRLEVHDPSGLLLNYTTRLPLTSDIVKKAKTFLQCESASYLLYEFWTSDLDAILDACLEIPKLLVHKAMFT